MHTALLLRELLKKRKGCSEPQPFAVHMQSDMTQPCYNFLQLEQLTEPFLLSVSLEVLKDHRRSQQPPEFGRPGGQQGLYFLYRLHLEFLHVLGSGVPV